LALASGRKGRRARLPALPRLLRRRAGALRYRNIAPDAVNIELIGTEKDLPELIIARPDEFVSDATQRNQGWQAQ
ncbi:MAG: hypothetical protein AAF197_11235, partial [Pseudomonadota bacterium]